MAKFLVVTKPSKLEEVADSTSHSSSCAEEGERGEERGEGGGGGDKEREQCMHDSRCCS